MGQVGICIVHDVNHGSGLPSASSRYALGAIVDLVRIPTRIIPSFENALFLVADFCTLLNLPNDNIKLTACHETISTTL